MVICSPGKRAVKRVCVCITYIIRKQMQWAEPWSAGRLSISRTPVYHAHAEVCHASVSLTSTCRSPCPALCQTFKRHSCSISIFDIHAAYQYSTFMQHINIRHSHSISIFDIHAAYQYPGAGCCRTSSSLNIRRDLCWLPVGHRITYKLCLTNPTKLTNIKPNWSKLTEKHTKVRTKPLKTYSNWSNPK